MEVRTTKETSDEVKEADLSGLMTAAIEYASKGYSIIPCKPDKKSYVDWKKYQKERASKEQIINWWKKWPDAMIGIVTGPVSNLFVLDADTENGVEIVETFLKENSITTPIANTPRGGKHYYFAFPDDGNPTVATNQEAGLDYRGKGGYIIAPPSINNEGKFYSWDGPSIHEMELGVVSASHIIKYIYITASKKNEEVLMTPIPINEMFVQSRRDNDLFHIADCLVKGGTNKEDITQVLQVLAEHCKPPYPIEDIKYKIESALERAELRDKALSDEVREWVLSSSGVFFSSEIAKALHLSSSSQQKNLSKILSRLLDKGTIQRYGDKNGCYRRVETDVEEMDYLHASTETFDLSLPFDIHKLCSVYPSNIIVVAGSKSAGKTAFLLNTVRLNMDRHDIVYMNSEMGDSELRIRLEKFKDIGIRDWKFHAYPKADNWSDLITEEKKIFIIDYMEPPPDKNFMVATDIKEIHKKLRDGVCIIGLQKEKDKDVGRGASFSMEKSRLYLALDYDPISKSNAVKIVDAKAWSGGDNPKGKILHYKLIEGANYLLEDNWSQPQPMKKQVTIR